MGEERELLMVLALNRAKVSELEIAIAYWGLDEIERHWDPIGWMRGRVRYRLAAARKLEERKRGGG